MTSSIQDYDTDANEDDKIDETYERDEKGDIITDAPDYQKDGENDEDDNDEADDSDSNPEIRCRARLPHCTGNWVRTFFRITYVSIKTTF